MLHGNKKIIKQKVGLLNLAEELGNISKACRIMGLSRVTFFRYKTAVDEGGVDSLIDKDRRKPNLKSRVDEQTEAAVMNMPSNFQPMDRFEPAMNCEKRAYSFHPAVFAVSGCVIKYPALKTASELLKRRWPRKV